MTLDSIVSTLSYDTGVPELAVWLLPSFLLSERDKKFIIYAPLRAARLELPLLPLVAIVKFGHLRNHALHINAEQLPLLLPELDHYVDR
jgi:hypothetical protein